MQRLHAILLLVLLAGAGWLLFERRGAAPPTALPAVETPLLDVILPRAALAATLDVRALERSAGGRALLGELAALAGAGSCEARLLPRVARIALTIPHAASPATSFDLGIVAESDLRASELMPCGVARIERRGGEAVRSRFGRFELLRDRRAAGEIALRDDGQLILSGGGTFRDLLDHSAGAASESDRLRDRLHRALRARVGEGALVLTWLLPPGWLERWLEDAELRSSPLAEARALALRADVPDELRVHVRVRAEGAASAARLEQFVRGLERDVAPGLGLRELGAAIRREGDELAIDLRTEAPSLAPLLAPVKP